MKILIVEDSHLIVDAVAQIVELRWPEVHLISTTLGRTGVEMARKEKPDVVILDVGLPDIDGFQTLQEIRSFSDVPVVFLTARNDEMDKIKGLELGADDYVVKPFSPGEFLARVRAVLRRRQVSKERVDVSSRPFIMGRLRIDFTSREVSIGDNLLNLSPVEFDILRELVASKGEVIVRQTLLERVSGSERSINLEYLDLYAKNLKEKLEEELGHEILILEENGYSMK